MALPGFRNHPKFRRLVAALGIPEPHALGHIEMMWEVAYERTTADTPAPTQGYAEAQQLL